MVVVRRRPKLVILRKGFYVLLIIIKRHVIDISKREIEKYNVFGFIDLVKKL
jgi:hypothetical protein